MFKLEYSYKIFKICKKLKISKITLINILNIIILKQKKNILNETK